jgi:hypothetical protein
MWRKTLYGCSGACSLLNNLPVYHIPFHNVLILRNSSSFHNHAKGLEMAFISHRVVICIYNYPWVDNCFLCEGIQLLWTLRFRYTTSSLAPIRTNFYWQSGLLISTLSSRLWVSFPVGLTLRSFQTQCQYLSSSLYIKICNTLLSQAFATSLTHSWTSHVIHWSMYFN